MSKYNDMQDSDSSDSIVIEISSSSSNNYHKSTVQSQSENTTADPKTIPQQDTYILGQPCVNTYISSIFKMESSSDTINFGSSDSYPNCGETEDYLVFQPEKFEPNIQQSEHFEVPPSPLRKPFNPQFANPPTVLNLENDQNDILSPKTSTKQIIYTQKEPIIEPEINIQNKLAFLSLNIQNNKNNWEEKLLKISNALSKVNPDVIGTQETLYWQLDQIRGKIHGYGQYGSSRNGYYNQQADEFCAVLYKSDKLKVIQGETFFLSLTPQEVSKSWGSEHNRIATAVKFEIIATQKQFWFFNTQLDTTDETVRCNQLQVILERMKTLNTEGLSIVLSGDFNSDSLSSTYHKLIQEGNMHEAKNALEEYKTRQSWIFTDNNTKIHSLVMSSEQQGVRPIVSNVEFK
ncbi:endonuclease/exonuclease/phosphatase_family protein [Hexamita inflata]|uniref:Endonuclease/exonuclease/phosphatase family protein n=1 Tax=Hexamita inflata TaxID=28002 RepID=A0AA86PS59_9EUKA|nr:endonuclease/exonuclease/phosphatase family protein [Hexamita inflata]